MYTYKPTDLIKTTTAKRLSPELNLHKWTINLTN